MCFDIYCPISDLSTRHIHTIYLSIYETGHSHPIKYTRVVIIYNSIMINN